MTDEQKRNRFPRSIIVFFLVIFAVNIGYIYLSKTTWRGTVTEESYQKGMDYNDTLKAVEKQEELGWSASVKFQSKAAKLGVLTIDLRDKNGAKISDADVYVNFKRPTQEGEDFMQAIPLKKGIYQAEIIFPLIGQWDFEIVAKRGGDSFQEVKRYIVQ